MLLSICIPTYNRAEYLPALLDSLLPFANQIEIAISDNASTDNTETVIAPYAAKFPLFQFSRAPENQGPDRNYFRAANMATCPYLMLCGSDDAIEPQGFTLALQNLAQYHPTLLVTERLNCDNQLTPINQSRFLHQATPRLFPLTTQENIITYLQLGHSIGAVYSYLSNTIILKDAWHNAPFDENFMGSAYPHVYKFLQILQAPAATLYFQPQPMVRTRLFNDSFLTHDYARRALLDVNGYHRLATSCFAGMPQAAKALTTILQREIIHTHFGRILRFSLVKSRSKPESWQAYFTAARQAVTMPPLFICLDHFPLFFHKAVVATYQWLKKIIPAAG